MKRNKHVEIQFDAGELIRRMENLAKHATGEMPLNMRMTRLALPPLVKPLKPHQIAGIRKTLGVSQGVFAALLNVPRPTAISWESGARRPSGAALRGAWRAINCAPKRELGRHFPNIAAGGERKSQVTLCPGC